MVPLRRHQVAAACRVRSTLQYAQFITKYAIGRMSSAAVPSATVPSAAEPSAAVLSDLNTMLKCWDC